jgi:hypothetical protein
MTTAWMFTRTACASWSWPPWSIRTPSAAMPRRSTVKSPWWVFSHSLMSYAHCCGFRTEVSGQRCLGFGSPLIVMQKD